MPDIKLRKFPWPFQAAMAINSDLDNTCSGECYTTMMDYLNSDRQTPIGKGLALETANSIWFYNNTTTPQVSWFNGTGKERNTYTARLVELMQSGHIDTLHTFGNFNEGGFKREHALAALDELEKLGVKLPVWVNHGNKRNTQNIGYWPTFFGAVPSAPEYHFNLVKEYGIRYFGLGKTTHILGQDAANNPGVYFKNNLQKALRYTKYRNLPESPFDLQNRLMWQTTLQDGSRIWEFQRWINPWGGKSTTNLPDLARQLDPKYLHRLIANQGYLVLYTHICDGLNIQTGIPAEVRRSLEYLSALHKDKILLVTTTARLLKYYEVSRNINYKIITNGNQADIFIEPQLSVLNNSYQVTPNDLQGVTFKCKPTMQVTLYLGRERIKCTQYETVGHKKMVITVPWVSLPYPC
ncbi:MAG TPA: hypothetical protein PLP19_00570 [bacterium]|nr:hypothetical protein [bacterium]HPN41957.1 hypothetical protein [bacterium]